MSTATTNTDGKWAISISHGKLTTSDSTKTLTISTAGKYVDKDIIVTSAATKPDAGTVQASSPSITPSISSTANADKSYNITGSATVTVSSETAGYISSSVGTRTSGTASISGTVAGSTLDKTSVTPSTSEQTVTIGAGYYPTSRTVTVKSLADITQSVPVAVDSLGTNTDEAGEGKIILASGGALKVPAGYVANDLYFSLAGLVPDDANITESSSSPYILSGKTAYDKDGKLITGGIANLGNPSTTYYQTTAGVSGSKITAGKYVNQDLYIKSGSAGTPSATVTASVGSWTLQSTGTNAGKYTATISGTNAAGATVTNTTGWITGSTKTGTATASGTAVLNAATCTVEGGTVTTTAGTASASASCTSTGMTNGISSSATAYYVTATASASATGGSASITDVTDTHTAGYLPAKNTTTVITGTSKTGASSGQKSDSKTVYLKAAALTHGNASGDAGSVAVSGTATGIATTTTATSYYVTVSGSATAGTITHDASVSAGYTEGDTKSATLTVTPGVSGDGTKIYFNTTSLTNSVTATKGGANNTNYSDPVTTTTASTSIPQIELTGSGSGTTKRVLTSNGTAAKKYIDYYTGTYTIA